MKKILALALVMASSTAFAQTQTPVAQQQQTSTSTSQSDATNAGNNQTVNGPTIVVNTAATDTRDVLPPQTINQNVTQAGDTTSRVISSGSQTIKNTPSVNGSPLTSSNDTCMGSTTGSVNVAGFGGSLGSTWTDENCKMLKNSRELWNMGMKAASLALMCTDAANREALELTGFKCPTRKQDKQVVQGDGERYTDPIVRSRLGLPPLN